MHLQSIDTFHNFLVVSKNILRTKMWSLVSKFEEVILFGFQTLLHTRPWIVRAYEIIYRNGVSGHYVHGTLPRYPGFQFNALFTHFSLPLLQLPLL